jgi:hypothetical protein
MTAAVCGVDRSAGQPGGMVGLPLHPRDKRQVEADGDEAVDLIGILRERPSASEYIAARRSSTCRLSVNSPA